MPDHPIPGDCRARSYDAALAYDLVWVRLDSSAGTAIPACPAWEDEGFRCVQGGPYTWPTSAARRLENFVDLSHFPFVHDGSLGDRRQTLVPIAKVDRLNGELRFQFRPSPEMQLPDVALMAPTDYRIWMPFTVNLEFSFPMVSAASYGWPPLRLNRAYAGASGSPAAPPTATATTSRTSISRPWC